MDEISKNQLLQQYQDMQENLEALQQKIAELQSDVDEHRLVCTTLQGVPDDRRAFRMVAGTLVERKVGEILPQLESNATALEGVIIKLEAQREKLSAHIQEMTVKYGIRRVSPEEMSARQQAAAGPEKEPEPKKEGGVGVLV